MGPEPGVRRQLEESRQRQERRLGQCGQRVGDLCYQESFRDRIGRLCKEMPPGGREKAKLFLFLCEEQVEGAPLEG